MARRGAWKVGEPDLSPGQLPVDERGRRIAAVFIPPKARKWAALLFMVAVVGGVFLGGIVAPIIDPYLNPAAAPATTVIFQTVPAGASVTVAGKELDGRTPLAARLELKPGTHPVKFKLGDNDPVAVDLSLTDGQTFAVVRSTLLETGKVKVTTRPKGATVYLDGKKMGTAPLTLDKVGYDGSHEIEARADGYTSAKLEVPVERAVSHSVRLVLKKTGRLGKAVILSHPAAEIVLDGESIGETGGAEREITVGDHELELRVPSLGVENRYRIDVPEEGVGRFYFDLTAGAQ